LGKDVFEGANDYDTIASFSQKISHMKIPDRPRLLDSQKISGNPKIENVSATRFWIISAFLGCLRNADRWALAEMQGQGRPGAGAGAGLDEDLDLDRKWKDRRESAEQVRKRLRSGWRHDPAILNQYFESCYNNWKVYTGPRTPKQVLKLQAIYKQAVYGDIRDEEPDDLQSVEGQKWEAWKQLKGVPQDMAKRRFITFLSEIDPNLIDVMPDERPPIGFPLDRKGNPICAKCNTVVGCSRPLLDQRKMNLRLQLFEHEDFHEPNKLKEWIRNALAHQRCVWGVHMPISKAEAKPFMDWFNREENRGFYPYDSMVLMEMVRDLVEHYHELVYDLMQHKAEIDAYYYNEQATRLFKLKEVYQQFSGEEYHFELPCTRDNESCNMRRIADGGRNHKHEVFIDPPTASNLNTMEEAIALRTQCQKLGLSPCTGIVKTIEERCEIYRKRIADHLEALRKANEAKIRNEKRAIMHRQEKDQVLKLSKDMLDRQIMEACNANQVDHIITLIKRGCNPNGESLRGINPMLCFILNDASGEKIEQIIKLKADMNRPNKYGITPLMLACRLKDTRAVHVLMKTGASALQKVIIYFLIIGNI
jgi:acyl-CoA-binding protein